MTSIFGVLEELHVPTYVVPVPTRPPWRPTPPTEAWRLMTDVLLARKEQFPQIAASIG